MIGDIVTNLRAALDHIVWELSVNSSIPIPSRRSEREIHFPILDAPNSGRFMKATRFVQSNERDIIESLQPYNRLKCPETELLAILNKLVNQDKHRMIVPTFQISSVKLSATEKPVSARIFRYGFTDYDIVGAVIREIPPEQLDPKVEFHVAFEIDDDRDMTYPITCLEDIHLFISDQVIPKFCSLL